MKKIHMVGYGTLLFLLTDACIKNYKMYNAVLLLKKECMNAHQVAEYYADVLDKHHIPMTEYDEIAVNALYNG